MGNSWTLKSVFSKNKAEASQPDDHLVVVAPLKNRLNYYQLFWIFFIGSFIGVIIETIWCYYRFKTIESRVGLVYGPFNTVYGFGAVAMSIYANRTEKTNPIIVFISCSLIGAGFEYLCSLFQELVFNSVSWHYSTAKYTFSLGGRTTMKYALMWGALGLIWVKIFFPWYRKFIDNFNINLKLILTVIATTFMIFNVVISLFAVRRQTERFKGIAKQTSIGVYFDKKFPDDKLKALFPNTVTIDDLNARLEKEAKSANKNPAGK